MWQPKWKERGYVSVSYYCSKKEKPPGSTQRHEQDESHDIVHLTDRRHGYISLTNWNIATFLFGKAHTAKSTKSWSHGEATSNSGAHCNSVATSLLKLFAAATSHAHLSTWQNYFHHLQFSD
jgi:hypothetical protein